MNIGDAMQRIRNKGRKAVDANDTGGPVVGLVVHGGLAIWGYVPLLTSENEKFADFLVSEAEKYERGETVKPLGFRYPTTRGNNSKNSRSMGDAK